MTVSVQEELCRCSSASLAILVVPKAAVQVWQVTDDMNTTDLSLFDSLEDVREFAGSIYDRTVNARQECADLDIPKHKKGYC